MSEPVMERGQFTFYASFARAIRRIRKPAERAAVYDAIVDYALFGTEPALEAFGDTAAVVFELVRPNLDAARRKAESGRLGGKAGKSGAEAEAEQGARASKTEPETESERKSERKTETDYPLFREKQKEPLLPAAQPRERPKRPDCGTLRPYI